MNADLLKIKFDRIGARAKVRPLVSNRRQTVAGPVVIDIGHDRRGEFFDIQAGVDVSGPSGTVARPTCL